jgi:hypothetical protein
VRRGQRAGAVDQHEGIEMRLQPFRAVERGLRDFDGR